MSRLEEAIDGGRFVVTAELLTVNTGGLDAVRTNFAPFEDWVDAVNATDNTAAGLTKSIICSSRFRTVTVRNVPESEKHQVETEYGMKTKSYGRTIQIDHIVSLELGGSNDISNLYPEPGSGPANYHVKGRLENKLHTLVCNGSMTLHTAQEGIARNWETLYRHVFGDAA